MYLKCITAVAHPYVTDALCIRPCSFLTFHNPISLYLPLILMKTFKNFSLNLPLEVSGSCPRQKTSQFPDLLPFIRRSSKCWSWRTPEWRNLRRRIKCSRLAWRHFTLQLRWRPHLDPPLSTASSNATTTTAAFGTGEIGFKSSTKLLPHSIKASTNSGFHFPMCSSFLHKGRLRL